MQRQRAREKERERGGYSNSVEDLWITPGQYPYIPSPILLNMEYLSLLSLGARLSVFFLAIAATTAATSVTTFATIYCTGAVDNTR